MKGEKVKKTTTELMPYNYFLADYILIYIIFNLFLYIIISRQAVFSRFVSREVFSPRCVFFSFDLRIHDRGVYL